MRKSTALYSMVFMLALLITGCSSKTSQAPQVPAAPMQTENKQVTVGVQPGQKAPDFSLLNEKDIAVTLSQLQGKVVVLNFWATWCGPCRAEMPVLERFHKEKAADEVLIGISVKEDKDTVMQFMQAGGYTYPVLRDSFAQTAEQYQIRAIPTTFIIDKQGVIRHKKVGPVTTEELKRLVEMAKK